MFRSKSLACILLFVLLANAHAQESREPAEHSVTVNAVVDGIIDGLNMQPKVLANYQAPKGLRAFTFSRDGERVAYTDWKTIVVQFDETKKLAAELPSEFSETSTIHLEPKTDSSRIALTGPQILGLFDVQNGKVISRRALQDPVEFLGFRVSSDGNLVAGLTTNRSLIVLDLSTGEFTERTYKNEGADWTKAEFAINNSASKLYLYHDPAAVVIVDLEAPGDEPTMFNFQLKVGGQGKIVAGTNVVGVMGDHQLSMVHFETRAMRGGVGDFKVLNAQVVAVGDVENLVGVGQTQLSPVPAVLTLSSGLAKGIPTWQLPDARPIDICWDAEGRRIAYRTGASKIKILQTPQWCVAQAYDQVVPILRELIDNRDYATLDAVAQKLANHPSQLAPRPFDHWYDMLRSVVQSLQSEEELADNEPPNLFSDWLVNSPESDAARLMLSQWHIDRAWKIRGGGLANSVSREQFEAFEYHLESARQTLGDAVSDKMPPQALALSLEIAKGLGWDNAQRAPILEALKQYPEFEPAHVKAIEMLLPRWGGQPGAVKDYITEICDDLGGRKGDRMYAILGLYLMNYFSPREFFDAVPLDRSRMIRGALLTHPGRDVSLSGYMNLVVWLYANKMTQECHDILAHYESHNLMYAAPLNDPQSPYGIARSLRLQILRQKADRDKRSRD